jgi:acid phosphatase
MLFRPFFLAALLASSASALYTRNDKGEKGKKPRVVPGIAFDRFITIWLENTDFLSAAADPNFGALTKQGIHLTNYFAVTHPSEPNYVASVGGDYFGMQNDNLNRVPQNVSSVVDLLEDKGISWAEYQEHMPETGFQGFSQPNVVTGANDYVRKHNPLVIFDAVANVPNRVNLIKNFTLLDQDIANDAIPQWAFITPNMTNDGHDTNITFSSKFSVNFLEPLLRNPRFNGPRTLILLTFDESGNSTVQNRVDSVLLGNAVPRELIGTSDGNFYNHYSEIATVEANWGLHTLGRYDVGANVFEFVAKKTGDRIRQLTTTTLTETFLNASYPGVFNTVTLAPLPIPNTRLVVNGRTVLDSIVRTWGSPVHQACAGYSDSLEIPSDVNPPVLPSFCH